MGIECMKSKAIIWRLYLNDSDSGTEKVDNRMSSRRIQTGRGDTRQGSITIWNLSRTRKSVKHRKMNQIPKVHTRDDHPTLWYGTQFQSHDSGTSKQMKPVCLKKVFVVGVCDW